jgi:hypothetical protein
VPVIRYGPQEETVPLWLANALGLGRVCMVEIGRVTVATGNASIEQKISAYPHKPTSAPLAADRRHPADLFG